MEPATAGDDESVITAAFQDELKELKHVVDSLVANGHVQTLMNDRFGNHTIQHLVIASSKIRTAGVASLQKTQLRASYKVSSRPCHR